MVVVCCSFFCCFFLFLVPAACSSLRFLVFQWNTTRNDATCPQLHCRSSLHLSREEKGCGGVRIWNRATKTGQRFHKKFWLLLPNPTTMQKSCHFVSFSLCYYPFRLILSLTFTGFNAIFIDNRPEGYLFDKESILEYVITKKNEVSRKMKEYEKQKRKEEVTI